MFVYISNRQNLWEWKNLMLFSAIFSLKLLQLAEFVYGRTTYVVFSL